MIERKIRIARQNMSLSLILLCNFVVSSCYGCLPNPPVGELPVIVIGDMMEPICPPNPCPTLTGSVVTVSAPTVDASCTYTSTATCDMTFSEIQFNGVPAPVYPTPQILTCDTATSQYTYIDGGGAQQPITTIECMCQANPCPALTGSTVTVSTPTADSACTYTATATCDNPYPRVIQYNGGGDVYMSPQTLTCDPATSQFTFVDMGGVVQQITSIDCNCDDNPCPVPPLGGMVSVSTPTVDATCTYTADAMCTPTTFSIQFNGGPPILVSPQTLTCDFGTMQYTYDNAGTPTTVAMIDCVCNPANPCPTPPTGAVGPPMATISTPPMMDANCAYTVVADCMRDAMTEALISFNGGPDLPAPQTLTCDPATMQYTYDNAGTPTTATTATCECGFNRCFTNRVPGVDGNPGGPTLDETSCIWYGSWTCAPMSLEFNAPGMGTPATIPSPAQRRCFSTIPTTQTTYEYEITPGTWTLAYDVRCGP